MNKTFQKQIKGISKMIHINLLICIILTLIISYFVTKFIPAAKEIEIISMIFIGIAIFFIELAITNNYSIKVFGKKGIKTKAIVNSCTKEVSQDASFYSIILNFEIEGKVYTHELISEKRMSVNKSIDIYYLIKEQNLILAEDYAECKRSDKALLSIALISLAISIIILTISYISHKVGGILLDRDFWLYGYGIVIGIIFIKIGYSMYKPKNTQKETIIEGKVLSYEEIIVKKDNKTKKEYYPTIEYFYKGEKLIYKSQEKTKKHPEGTMVYLSLDEDTTTIHIKEFNLHNKNAKRDGLIIMGIGIFVVALLILVIIHT